MVVMVVVMVVVVVKVEVVVVVTVLNTSLRLRCTFVLPSKRQELYAILCHSSHSLYFLHWPLSFMCESFFFFLSSTLKCNA